jgi:hypothetical protein
MVPVPYCTSSARKISKCKNTAVPLVLERIYKVNTTFYIVTSLG